MRKFIIFILAILLILPYQNASAKMPTVDVEIKGEKNSLTIANIEVDKRVVVTHTPAFIYNDRTFVPIRLVAENLGKEVSWIEKTNTAVIKTDTGEVEFSIDKDICIKNGKEIKLDEDSIPMLAVYDGEGKTVLPLRALAEILGYEVGWQYEGRKVSIGLGKTDLIDDSNKITDIKIENGSTKLEQIVINASEKLDYELFKDIDHNEVAIRIKNAKIAINSEIGKIDLDSELLNHIEYAQDNEDVKILISLKRDIVVKDILSNKDKQLRICFTNKVTSISPIMYKEKQAILVSGVKSSEYNIIKLSNPLRYVIDIKDASFYKDSDLDKLYFSIGFIKSIRASQFVPDKNYSKNDQIVRIVLDAKDNAKDTSIKVEKEGDDLVIIPSGNTDVLSDSNLNEDLGYSVLIPHENDTLDEEEHIMKPAIFREPKYAKSPQEIIIMIDAGHGGKDPGAIAKNGLKEKDFNIDVALRVEEKLKADNFTVLMMRRDDTSVDIYKRPEIANEKLADIFVSIHANSALSTKAHGIEVLYAPKTSSNLKYEEQKPLASAINEAVKRTTGMHSRGVIKKPNLIVLKNTQMVAALIECGFMSNPNDLETLMQESYKEQCAEGIYQGIRQYVLERYGF
ncbi:MAG: N-acetylmuramoyl-L-alanine amidase family protein [Tissierellia bacterium]|nr:N-acetylmuramoyl-L-alanine amidase family protein [Tissierellia bacterium]